MATLSSHSIMLFQKSLQDMIKGIRTNKKGEADFIQQCLDEIRQELKHKEVMVKVIAVSKMTYLYMLGHDMDFAAFNVIEIMSEASFANKRVGYLAATLAFHERLDVLPLCTNLIKKDLQSSNQFEVGLALTCLANLCTPELAHDVVSDVVQLLNSQRNYVRKKAVLCLYKVIQQYPGALRPSFPRLFEKLDESSDKCDPDPVVRCAVVSVLCELSRKHPANYLGLAVSFYNLLCSQLNNWTMIKIVKLFAALTPHEPRLGKKIAEPMTNIINTTAAKSLAFEACLTVAIGLGKTQLPVLKLALEKLRSFIEDTDQNLKFLGLVGMSHFMAGNPKMLVEFRENIVDCLKDSDFNIRSRALDLTQGLVSKKSLQNVVAKMTEQLVRNPPDDEWTNLLIKRIVQTIIQDDYACVTDFEWYLRVLMDLTQTQSTNFEHGELIANQFLEVTQRVTELRQFSVKCMVVLLSSPAVLTAATNVERSTHWKILRVAAHLVAEHVQFVKNIPQLLESLVDSRLVSFPGDFQSVCVSSIQKITLYVIENKIKTLDEVLAMLEAGRSKGDNEAKGMDIYYNCPDIETQERALVLKKFVLTAQVEAIQIQEVQKVVLETISVELKPVPLDAQRQVPIPEGLDLETPIAIPIDASFSSADESEEEEEKALQKSFDKDSSAKDEKGKIRKTGKAQDTKEYRKAHAALYLADKGGDTGARTAKDESLPPMVALPKDLRAEVDLGVKGLHKSKKSAPKTQTLQKSFDAPTGYTAKTSVSPKKSEKEEDDGLNIDILKPVGKNEVLPEIKAYVRPEVQQEDDEKQKRKEQRKAKADGYTLVGSLKVRPRKDLLLLATTQYDVDVTIIAPPLAPSSNFSVLIRLANKIALSLHHVEIVFDNLPPFLSLEGSEKKIAVEGKIGVKETKDVPCQFRVEDWAALYAAMPLALNVTLHYKTKEVKHTRVPMGFTLPFWMFCSGAKEPEEATSTFKTCIEAAQGQRTFGCTIPAPDPKELLLSLANDHQYTIVEILDDAATLCVITAGGVAAVYLKAISSGGLQVVTRSPMEALAMAVRNDVMIAHKGTATE